MAGWERVSIQIKAGILLGVEVESHAGLLRSLFCLWHSLLGFDLLFSLIILSHKQTPSFQPRGCCQGFADLSGDSCHLCCPSFSLGRLHATCLQGGGRIQRE